MTGAPSLPAYSVRWKTADWVVVIPVRGRLTPILWATSFQSKAEAETWIRGPAGSQAIRDIQDRGMRRA